MPEDKLMSQMKVREGRKEDAVFIAKAVMEAIGPELCEGLAGGADRIPLVEELFTELAALPDSQYSYSNSFIAEDENGKIMGAVVAYKGDDLHELRRAFVREANRILGWNVSEEEAEEWGDEADEGEIYIDSLYVVAEARRRGAASLLLKAVESRFAGSGKPLGLLVEPENAVARTVYSHWGFREEGISNFFRVPMIHMQKFLS